MKVQRGRENSKNERMREREKSKKENAKCQYNKMKESIEK
jgi:hypothetical protein